MKDVVFGPARDAVEVERAEARSTIPNRVSFFDARYADQAGAGPTAPFEAGQEGFFGAKTDRRRCRIVQTVRLKNSLQDFVLIFQTENKSDLSLL